MKRLLLKIKTTIRHTTTTTVCVQNYPPTFSSSFLFVMSVRTKIKNPFFSFWRNSSHRFYRDNTIPTVCYILTLTSLRAVLRVRQDTAVIKSLFLMSYVDLSKAPKVVKTFDQQREAASFLCVCWKIEKKIYV